MRSAGDIRNVRGRYSTRPSVSHLSICTSRSHLLAKRTTGMGEPSGSRTCMGFVLRVRCAFRTTKNPQYELLSLAEYLTLPDARALMLVAANVKGALVFQHASNAYRCPKCSVRACNILNLDASRKCWALYPTSLCEQAGCPSWHSFRQLFSAPRAWPLSMGSHKDGSFICTC